MGPEAWTLCNTYPYRLSLSPCRMAWMSAENPLEDNLLHVKIGQRKLLRLWQIIKHIL